MNKMTRLNRKKLIIIAFFIIIALVILLIILGKTNSMDRGNIHFAKQSEFKSNSEKLVDYGNVVMKYGNDIFILDKLSNSIIKHNTKDGTNSTVIHFENANYSEHFFIRSNQLIFSYDNATYYSDLNGNNIKKFTNGEIVYIDDDVYILISHKTSRDELYIVSYNNKTFRTTMELSHNIANAKTIQYLKSDGEMVYFTSINSNGKLSILEVDVKNSISKIITQMSKDSEYANTSYEISDILKDNEYYYYVVNEMTFTTYEEKILNYSYIYQRNVSENYEEIMAEDVGPYLKYHPKEKDTVLYEQYLESGDMIWQNMLHEETTYSWKELAYGDVTNYFSLENSSVYRDKEKLADLGMDVSEYTLKNVIRLDDGYYFMIDNEYNHIWYHCGENGDNLVKIN
ncbi:MAG: hypothetical protein IJ220_04220 [Clostridia bacterium]|nr:hypothetical protein [Clostridia bacterium]